MRSAPLLPSYWWPLRQPTTSRPYRLRGPRSDAYKWNPTEHRLFAEISKQWAGQPLANYATVLRLIRKTRTRTGLTVNCSLDIRQYPNGIKLTPEQMSRISLYRHAVLPNWNYTLLPNQNRN